MNNSFNDQLVCTINPYDLKNWVASDSFSKDTLASTKRKSKLQDFANSLDTFDNPVLVIIN